ncbi:MAG: hypothetical protein E7165_03095 [Firmicutes bacterium]|nr:hypothetical protein [Bacillota bacterium]
MKKKLLYIFIIFCFLFIPQLVNAQEEVNLYLFHSKDCMHCQSEREWLASIKEEYQYLNIYEYEVTRSEENSALLQKVKKQLSSTTKYVPFTVIGETYFVGWNENNKNKILEKIENYNYEQRDIVNEVLNGIEGEPIVKQDNEEQEGVSTFTIPLLGNIDAKKVSLPLVAAIIGFIDGFNPCAMWVLIFLISMLMGMKNKKRMWTLGLTFLCSSAMVYLLFMLAWLNIAISLNQIVWVRVLVAIVALIGAFLNLKSFYKSVKQKDSGCEVVDNNKRKKLMNRIKQFTSEKSFWLSILGVVALAFSVNIIELACSAGLPLIFTQILALNNLNWLAYFIYLIIYIAFFLLDDIIVFVVAMKTLELTGISTKYTKYSHLIGGLIMLLIGILMIFKPEWIMFNF